MVPFESLGTVSSLHSIATMALSCILFEIKRDIGGMFMDIHRDSKRTVHFCFCHNFVKFPRILIILVGIWLKRLKLYAVYTFSTKPDPCHYITC